MKHFLISIVFAVALFLPASGADLPPVNDGKPHVHPPQCYGGRGDPPKTLPRTEHHYREWTQACKTGSRTACPIEFGCEMTEMALLGTLVLRTGQVLEWDAEAMRVTNDEKANSLVDPPYCAGWSL